MRRRCSAAGLLPAPILLLLALLPSLAGCETAFDAFEASDSYFSIFGFLEAGADTQFVRVSPLRDSLYADADPLEAVVVLEHLPTGNITHWHDSLFTFRNGAAAHNFWSTEEILPGAAYRFRVTRPDGAVTTADVVMPEDFDVNLTANLGSGTTPDSQSVAVQGAERFAELRIVYELYETDRSFEPLRVVEISYLDRIAPVPGGVEVRFDAFRDLRAALPFGSCPRVVRARVVLAAVDPGWPEVAGMDVETLAILGFTLNVEQGVGFLGGTVRKILPWADLVTAMEIRRTECAE